MPARVCLYCGGCDASATFANRVVPASLGTSDTLALNVDIHQCERKYVWSRDLSICSDTLPTTLHDLEPRRLTCREKVLLPRKAQGVHKHYEQTVRQSASQWTSSHHNLEETLPCPLEWQQWSRVTLCPLPHPMYEQQQKGVGEFLQIRSSSEHKARRPGQSLVNFGSC